MEKRSCKAVNENISIVSFLEKLGHKPVRVKGAEWRYHSPYREDPTPSFYVNIQKNLWKDFAGGAGTLIDLYLLIFPGQDVKAALDYFSGSFNSIPAAPKVQQQVSKLTINKVQPLQNAALLQYGQSRGIPDHIQKTYLEEAYYSFNEKSYFSLAFKNSFGGYELRNKYFKNSSSPKGYTLLPGGNKELSIFEGFFDFLSFATVKNGHFNTDILVLNSLSFAKSCSEIIKRYTKSFAYLDQDPAGQKTLEEWEAEQLNVVDKSLFYKDFGDLNEWHMKHYMSL